MKSLKRNNTNDWLPVEGIRNGFLETSNKHKVGALRINPKNIFILDNEDREAVINALKYMFNEVDCEITILAIDQEVNLDDYVKSIYQKLSEIDGDNEKLFLKRMLTDDLEKANMFKQNGVKDIEFYVCLRDREVLKIKEKLYRIKDGFKRAGLESEYATNKDLRRIVNRIYNHGKNYDNDFSDIKTILSPKGLFFKPVDFIVGDKYATVITINKYPNYIPDGFLYQFLLMNINVSLNLKPMDNTSVRKMLNKKIRELESRIDKEQDVTKQADLQNEIINLKEFVTNMAVNKERVFESTLSFYLTADSSEELIQKKKDLINYIDSREMRGLSPLFMQEKAFKSLLPFFDNKSFYNVFGYPLPSHALATMYPFVFDTLRDPGKSCLLGVDVSGGVILYDQFSRNGGRNNSNVIILGRSGSGKSTTGKAINRNHISNGFQQIFIDPEEEYKEMILLNNGQYVDLGKLTVINPLDVIFDIDEEEAREIMQQRGLTDKETIKLGL